VRSCTELQCGRVISSAPIAGELDNIGAIDGELMTAPKVRRMLENMGYVGRANKYAFDRLSCRTHPI
jgi:hypothetical protein